MSETQNTNTEKEDLSMPGPDAQEQMPAIPPEPGQTRRPDAGLSGLFIEALRASVLKQPRWENVKASPAIIAALVLAYLLYTIVFSRLAIAGPARFYWPAVAGGWFSFASWAWICYSLRHRTGKTGQVPSLAQAPDASHLFVLSMAQGLVVNMVLNAPLLLAGRMDWLPSDSFGPAVQWLLFLLPVLVAILVQSVFLWRASDRHPGAMFIAVIVMMMALGLQVGTRQAQYWYPKPAPDADKVSEDKSPEITQEVFESQSALFLQKLDEIQKQRPGVIDLYSLSFAPYGEEDVFLNETSMVSKVMEQRFDAAGRSLQLVNNPRTMETLPWATPLNLQRAIAHMAKRMDVNEDILFIHMSSHGASDGELSAGMWPLTVNPVTPDDLKRWLDEAGIRHRVISISACFAGNWVQPLSDPDSLVMTASDADHTSYGCGSKSDLTFFGRAMYDEQLRKRTLSFEAAHAAARPIIKQREEEAGKSDGYSNPQIAVGENIRQRLQMLEDRLKKSVPVRAD